jgi:hypothetical protein
MIVVEGERIVLHDALLVLGMLTLEFPNPKPLR